MNQYILDEVMNLEKGNEMSVLNSYMLMQKLIGNVQLINDEKNVLSYQVDVEEIIDSSIEAEDLIKLRTEGGWEYSEDKTKLIKFLV